MQALLDVLMVIVLPAAIGVIHWHLRWAFACAAVMGWRAFWKGYVRKLSPERHNGRAIVIAPLAFTVGTLPYVLVSSLIFRLAVWASHGTAHF